MRKNHDRDEGRARLTFILFAFVILALSLNEAVYDFAVANSVYETSQAATYVGLTFLIAYVAEIVTSFFLSGLSDKPNRIQLFAGLQILMLLAFLGTAMVIIWAPEQLTLLWSLTFVFDALNHSARLFMFAIIPLLFSGRGLWKANGIMAIGAGLSRSLGPVAVGIIGFGSGNYELLVILVACVLLSSFITLHLHSKQKSPNSDVDSAPQASSDSETDVSGTYALWRAFSATGTILRQPMWRNFAMSYAAIMTLVVVSPLLWIPAFSSWHSFTLSEAVLKRVE